METAEKRNIPVMTVLLIGVNVLVWLYLELTGDTQDSRFMIEHGASFWPLITEQKEYWRLFTCMFLHFGADHLMNNMLMLGIMGNRLEYALGRIRFGILYLGSGLCGSLLSLYKKTGDEIWIASAGASGAIFGVIGSLMALAIWNRGKVAGLTAKGLLGMATLSLYFGFVTAEVDNWGHIGGLFSGFIIGCVYGAGDKIYKIPES